MYGLLLEGHTSLEIRQGLGAEHKAKAIENALDGAVKLFAEASREPHAAVTGWCLTATRDLYRKSVEVADFDGARQCVKLLHDIIKRAPETSLARAKPPAMDIDAAIEALDVKSQ